MKSIVNAKKKNSRRYGQNLWGDANSPILKRNYAPGQHGQRRKKTTDYGEQLYAKQRLKVYYGNISEKQFHKYYEEAIRRRGDAAENLLISLKPVMLLKFVKNLNNWLLFYPQFNLNLATSLLTWKLMRLNYQLSILLFRNLMTFLTPLKWNQTWLSSSTPDNSCYMAISLLRIARKIQNFKQSFGSAFFCFHSFNRLLIRNSLFLILLLYNNNTTLSITNISKTFLCHSF